MALNTDFRFQIFERKRKPESKANRQSVPIGVFVTHKKGFILDISQVKILCVLSRGSARKSAKIKGQKFGTGDSNFTLAEINYSWIVQF